MHSENRNGGIPLHVAIIMDGSGRWAVERGLPRSEGHRAGVAAVRRTVSAARELGIRTLTLHAFSSDNWQRPRQEVAELMNIFADYLGSSIDEWAVKGIRATVFGRRDRLAPWLVAAIEKAEARTRQGSELHLRLAIDYSARSAILQAARWLPQARAVTPEIFSCLLAEAGNETPYPPDVDLLIRTGGEQRLSDFMLWECAYAELYFSKRRWPDFDAADLAEAISEFHRRERRFGRIPLGVTLSESNRMSLESHL
jgi:undecaprenyl diphosphate synthase